MSDYGLVSEITESMDDFDADKGSNKYNQEYVRRYLGKRAVNDALAALDKCTLENVYFRGVEMEEMFEYLDVDRIRKMMCFSMKHNIFVHTDKDIKFDLME